MKIFRNTLITLSAVIFVISSCSQSEDVSETPIIEEIKMVQAIIKTSVGEIHLELDREKAPITVDNFIAIAESGYYTDTIFHRVINGFMIQGGVEKRPSAMRLLFWTTGHGPCRLIHLSLMVKRVLQKSKLTPAAVWQM